MTVCFKTFGCRLNRAETAQFESAFASAGITRVPFGAQANIVVLHTCAITQTAENAGVKFVKSVRQLHPSACLVMAGCAVETVSAETIKTLGVDLIVPRESKAELVPLVMRHLGIKYVLGLDRPQRTTKRASLKIQDGCDFFCAYCIVPHTRGKPYSRPYAECLHEAQTFINAGFQEIVVTGCNIACYADGSHSLIDLISALVDLPGLGRLRLGSIEPGTIEQAIITLMANSPHICRFLHLPIQSGDNYILKAMRRRYTVESLSATLHEALHQMPYLGLGADIITGFPGETPKAFENTQNLLTAFPFSNLHVFPYSERPGTPAATFGESVPETERKQRATILNQLKLHKRAHFARSFVGRKVEVLIERFDANHNAHGWTGEYLDCCVSGLNRSYIAQCVTCVPHAAEGECLFARCL